MTTGTPLARAFVRLDVEAGQASESIVQAVRTGGQKGQHEAESQGKAIGERIKKGLEFGAGFYGGELLFRGVAEGLKSVVESADQLKESSERVDRVFGESSGSVLKFGQDAAKSYGLSAAAADQMSVKLGALLTNLHLPQEEAAKMSIQLVKLASDLAAFNHTDTASAEQALQSALAGRTQGLKQYGIVVDSVSVQQQALKDGLIHTVKDALDPAAKAQATYEVILQRSGVQQGAFARQSNSLAGQTAILKAEMTDAASAIGSKLVPVLVDGAKGLQDIPRIGAGVTNFFDHNKAAAVALAAVLGFALVPKLSELAITTERVVSENLAAFFTEAAAGASTFTDVLVANPELFALSAGLAAAGAALELFAGKEKSASVDVQSLTQAVKDQDTVGGSSLSNEILKQFEDTSIGNKGENVLEYLQRYKVNVAALIDEIERGNHDSNFSDAGLQALYNDPSVNPKTLGRLNDFFYSLTTNIGSARAAEDAIAKQHAATIAALQKTPGGQFTLYLGNVQKAQDALTKSSADNNKTISGQIDLLKGYQVQAGVTADAIQKSLLASIKTLAGEGDNLKKLAANGVSGDFIKKLVSEGPEYVAALAGANKQTQLQLSQLFAQGNTQTQHTSDEASRAENPQQAAAVAFFNGLQSRAANDAMAKTFYTAVQDAVTKAKGIAADGGRDTANAFGAKGEAGKNAVLQRMLNTLPGPVRIAALAALGIATDAGGKLPKDLAAAIEDKKPIVVSAAEALRVAVQNRIDLLHGKTIDITTQDNASSALGIITGDLKQLEGLNNTLKATRYGAADGWLVSGPGGPRDDVIPAWLSNGEAVIPAHLVPEIAPWASSRGIPGFAAGGYVDKGTSTTDVLSSHPFVQSLADYLSSSSFGSLLSGASGGATSAGGNVELGRMLAGGLYGWTGAEFDALNKLWTRESGWNANAVNPSSGAYGIPQSLGHGHPFNLGDARAQELWGMDYIKGRYGDPISAWAHEVSAGWYHNGGKVHGSGNVPAVLKGGEYVSTAADMGQVVTLLGKLIKAVDRNAVVTGSSVASALNGTARAARTDLRTRTFR